MFLFSTKTKLRITFCMVTLFCYFSSTIKLSEGSLTSWCFYTYSCLTEAHYCGKMDIRLLTRVQWHNFIRKYSSLYSSSVFILHFRTLINFTTDFSAVKKNVNWRSCISLYTLGYPCSVIVFYKIVFLDKTLSSFFSEYNNEKFGFDSILSLSN